MVLALNHLTVPWSAHTSQGMFSLGTLLQRNACFSYRVRENRHTTPLWSDLRLAQHGAWARVGVRWFDGMAGGPITPCALRAGTPRLYRYLLAPPDRVIGAGWLVAPHALAIGEGGYPTG
jgi:hypothetical protein